MSLGSSSSALHINAPGSQRSPTGIRLNPSALFTILDHHLRKRDGQARVIGTLMGTRTESEIQVLSAFAVLHSETQDQVAIDEEYFQHMLEVTQKVQPRESVVGWYSTAAAPSAQVDEDDDDYDESAALRRERNARGEKEVETRGMNSFSALFQNYYANQTGGHQAIHLVVDTGDHSQEFGVKAYLGSPMGVSAKPDNCAFVPIPVVLRQVEAERPGLNLLQNAASQPNHVSGIQTDYQNLERSLHEVISMIDRVQTYVKRVISGEIDGDAAVGRYLLDTLNTTTEGLEKGKLESLFNIHVQDTLMVSYLANLVRSQAEVSNRLMLVT